MMRLIRTYLIIICMCLWPFINGHCSLPIKKIQVERLPDLNIPRCGHSTLVVDGVLYVFGGHTTGFVPTPTAEYFENGEWHTLQMIYPHDHALSLPLSSGKVLICGGHKEPLGIGQTFTLELFDPETRIFEGYGCMDKKRFLHSGAQLPDGRVIISGNSFHKDGIECFDGTRQNQFVKDVAQTRSRPLIFPIAAGNALIFGSITDSLTVRKDTVIVDQLQGPPLHIPLFNEWNPYPYNFYTNPSACFVGDEHKGYYAYLITVFHRESGQMAFARIEGTNVSLVETDAPVPMQWEDCHIEWFSNVIVDHRAKKAYVVGRNEKYHICIMALDYDKQPAHLSFYETDQHDATAYQEPVLLPDGDLLIAGGSIDNYYTPAVSVIRYCVSTNNKSETQANTGWSRVLIIVIVVMVAFFVIWFIFSKLKKSETAIAKYKTEAETETNQTIQAEEQLMATIIQLMEQQRLYLNSELKVADIAELAGTSSRNVSDCIKAARGCSFSQFVNSYRIDYAKQLLVSEPDIKVAAVALQSGFANEMSFFRTFKTITSMTPKEWKDTQVS